MMDGKVQDAITKAHSLFRAFYVRLDRPEEELGAEEDYHILCRGVCSREVFQDGVTYAQAATAIMNVEKWLANCAGIVVDDCRITPEYEFSLEDMRSTQKWDFDYLSYSEDPIAETLTRTDVH